MREDPIEYEREARISLAESSRELKRVLDDIAIEMSAFKRKTTQILEEGITDIASKANASLQTNVAAFAQVAQEMTDRIQSAFSTFTDHAAMLNDNAGKNVAALEALFQRIERIEASPDLIAAKLDPVIAKFATAADAALARTKAHEGDLAALRASAEAALRAAQALEQAVQSSDRGISQSIAGLAREIETITTAVARLRTASDGATDALARDLEANRGAANRVLEALETQIRTSRTAAMGLEEAVGAAAVGLKQAVGSAATDLQEAVGAAAHNATAALAELNASALRASLVGFYLAFWEHVLQDRGGLKLLVLDDPQELLDEENRERLAHAFEHLLKADAQLVVTTYDRRFAGHVAALTRKITTIDHRSIHPVTPTRATLQTAPSVTDILRKQEAYEADVDDAAAAREYSLGRTPLSDGFSSSIAAIASSMRRPISGWRAAFWRADQRADCGTQKTFSARYSSRSSGSPIVSSMSWRRFASKASEMYLRKIRPRTTCL